MKFWHTKRGHATFLLVMDVLSVLLAETIAFFVTDTAPFGREILLWMGANVALARAVFVSRAGICRRVFADDAFRRVENTACRGVADGAEYRFCGGYRAARRFRFHRAGIRHIFNEFCGVFSFLQAPERNNRRIFPPRFQGQKARDDRGRRRNRASDRQGAVHFEARFFPPRMYSGRR